MMSNIVSYKIMPLKQLDLQRSDISKGNSRKCENLAKHFGVTKRKKETKSKNTIGDIKDQHGDIHIEDVYKITFLRLYFQ